MQKRFVTRFQKMAVLFFLESFLAMKALPLRHTQKNMGFRSIVWGKHPVWETGNVNLDGTVSMADVVMLQKYLLRKQPLYATAGTAQRYKRR